MRPAWLRPRSPALREGWRAAVSVRAGSAWGLFLPALRPPFLLSAGACGARLSRPGRWGACWPLAWRPGWLFGWAGRCLSGAAATVLAGRTAVSAPVKKWGSNLGACCGCPPCAGRGRPSRRPRRERLRFSPPSRGALFLVSSMMFSSFLSSICTGCTCRTLTGRAGCAGLGWVGAGSGAAVSQGWPLTTGIFLRFSFSMPARYSHSSGAQKLIATPSAPARAVRPMRWT